MERLNKNTPMAEHYLSQIVSYGGEEMTRGAMMADLHKSAAKICPNDPARQRRIVTAYMSGHLGGRLGREA